MKTIKKVDLPGIKRLSPLEMNALHISCAHSPMRERGKSSDAVKRESTQKKDL